MGSAMSSSDIKIIPFPEPDAEAHAQAETELKRKLFAWADALLQQLGLTRKVKQAQSVNDLHRFRRCRS